MQLWQAERGLELAPINAVGTEKGASLSYVISLLHFAARQILALLKEYKRTNPSVYEELRQQCYGQSRSLYYGLVERIGQFHRSPLPSHTGFDSLLSSGYNVYEIENLRQSTDPDAIEVQNMALYSTPEHILHDMASANLVFGLSATADIERHLHHFSLYWLRNQPEFNWIETTPDDQQLIAELRTTKTEARKNRVFVHELPTLEEEKLQRVVDQLADERNFANRRPNEYHKDRVRNFFAILEWLTNATAPEPQENNSHLIFVSSFKQIRLLFNKSEFFKHPIYTIQPNEGRALDTYTLKFRKRHYQILFLDAAQGGRILENPTNEEEYNNLFRGADPVIVITQFASAGAGINLQFNLDSTDSEQRADYSHIYILDLPYYFFGPKEQSGNRTRKKNIWQLAKLFHGKQISEHNFRRLLSETNGGLLSDEYIRGEGTRRDAMLNRLVTLIQALGRVERTWDEMSEQHVVMCKEAITVFEQYLTDESFKGLRNKRLYTNSANLTMVLNGIEKLTRKKHRIAQRTADTNLPLREQKCAEAIAVLLDRIKNLTEGNQDSEIRIIWEELRRVTLRHDFQFIRAGDDKPLLAKYYMIHPTDYIQARAVYLDDDKSLLDPILGVGQQWRLDTVYDIIRENEIISDYFRKHRYEMGFVTASQIIFTPYAYQSVLSGAVGEEAIKALLNHEWGQNSTEVLPDSLYELADFKITDKSIFIDAKYYSDRTMSRFGLSIFDRDQRYKLGTEYFKKNAVTKLNRIQNRYGDTSRLIFINMASAEERQGIELYDAQFKPVHPFKQARIIVIQGALQRQHPNKLTPGMQTFIDHINRSIDE
jgi:hypothetical protein